MDTLTERIRAAREQAGLTQTDIAKALGISPSAVNQWEQGFTKNIKLEHFFTLARLLGQDPQWLATGKPLPQAREATAKASTPNNLSPTKAERALLHYIRQMPATLQQTVLRFLKRLSSHYLSHNQLGH